MSNLEEWVPRFYTESSGTIEAQLTVRIPKGMFCPAGELTLTDPETGARFRVNLRNAVATGDKLVIHGDCEILP